MSVPADILAQAARSLSTRKNVLEPAGWMTTPCRYNPASVGQFASLNAVPIFMPCAHSCHDPGGLRAREEWYGTLAS